MTIANRLMATAFSAALVMLLPFAASADPGKGKGHGKKFHAHKAHSAVIVNGHAKHGKAHRKHKTERAVRRSVRIVDGAPVIHVNAACPPGLAKKTPACIPPGQARKALRVGDRITRDNVHWISRPGLYGLGPAPDGSRYAVVDGRLVRLSARDMQVLSIVRVIDAILD